MSLAVLANHMASKGRNGDTMLIHMAPSEVAGLQALGLQHGVSMTINPETGLPEAFSFKSLLKSALPMIAGFALGPAGFGVVSSALGAGALVGGATALATGSLQKGLMAGLGAYGGVNLGSAFQQAGMATSQAALGQAAAEEAAKQGLTGDAAGKFIQDRVLQGAGQITPLDQFKAGITGLANAPGRDAFMSAVGGGSGLLKAGYAAAAPIIADQAIQTATPMPGGQQYQGTIRPYKFDPYTKRWMAQPTYPATPVNTAAEPPPEQQPGGMAGGGIVALAGGGEVPYWAAHYAPSDPNFSSRVEEARRSNDPTAYWQQYVRQRETSMAPPRNYQRVGSVGGIPLRVGTGLAESSYVWMGNRPISDLNELQAATQRFGLSPEETMQATRLISENSKNKAIGADLYSPIFNAARESLGSGYTMDQVYEGAQKNFGVSKADVDAALRYNNVDPNRPSVLSGEEAMRMAREGLGSPAQQPGGMAGGGIVALANGGPPPERTGSVAEQNVLNTKDWQSRSGLTGIEGLNSNINMWFAERPQVSEQEVRNAMQHYGLNDADIMRATGKAVGDLVYRPPVVTSAPTTAPGYTGTDNTYGGTDVLERVTPAPLGTPGRATQQNLTMQQVRDEYQRGGGSLGMPIIPFTPTPLTGGSKAAYDYLMGRGDYPNTPFILGGGPIMRPYSEIVGGSGSAISRFRPTMPPRGEATTGTTGGTTGTTTGTTTKTTGGTTGTTTGGTTGTTTGGTTIVGGGTSLLGGTTGGTTSDTTGGTTTGTTRNTETGDFYTPVSSTPITDFLFGTQDASSVPVVDRSTYTDSYIQERGGDILRDMRDADIQDRVTAEDEAQRDAIRAEQERLLEETIQRQRDLLESVGNTDYYDYGQGYEDLYDPGYNYDVGTGYYGGSRYNPEEYSNLFRKGGLADIAAAAAARGGNVQQYNLGGYSDGGRLLRGPGDGVSDSIPATIGNKQPARLADGEFVVPARIVSEIGNGSTEAGARKLYAMMDRVQRARAKTTGKGKVAKNTRAEKYLPA